MENATACGNTFPCRKEKGGRKREEKSELGTTWPSPHRQPSPRFSPPARCSFPSAWARRRAARGSVLRLAWAAPVGGPRRMRAYGQRNGDRPCRRGINGATSEDEACQSPRFCLHCPHLSTCSRILSPHTPGFCTSLRVSASISLPFLLAFAFSFASSHLPRSSPFLPHSFSAPQPSLPRVGVKLTVPDGSSVPRWPGLPGGSVPRPTSPSPLGSRSSPFSGDDPAAAHPRIAELSGRGSELGKVR